MSTRMCSANALLISNQSRREEGMFAAGDRIGVLLDLDAGWMRFDRNGKRCGPGFTEGGRDGAAGACGASVQGGRGADGAAWCRGPGGGGGRERAM